MYKNTDDNKNLTRQVNLFLKNQMETLELKNVTTDVKDFNR